MRGLSSCGYVFVWAAVATGAALAGFTPAGAQPPTAWLTGSALSRQLAEPVDVYWAGTPLRQALDSLAHAQRIAVLIDRRVDPRQELDLKLNGLPLDQVLREVAKNRGLGICWLGPVAYLGPTRVTARLRTVAELRQEDVRSLPRTVGRKFLLPERLRWEDFATPRDLLSELAAQSGIEISGLELVPHDLWAAADLPPLSLVDRLTLIAGQFDLTFQLAADGTAVVLIPVPDDVAIVRSYPGGRGPEQLAEKWAAMVPQSQIKVMGDKIFVRGLLEDHERIAESMSHHRGPRSTPAGRGQKQRLFTANIANKPVKQVLEHFSRQLELELKIDHEALEREDVSLQELISFSVENATFDELFEAVLDPVGCTFRRQGNVIEIRPAE